MAPELYLGDDCEALMPEAMPDVEGPHLPLRRRACHARAWVPAAGLLMLGCIVAVVNWGSSHLPYSATLQVIEETMKWTPYGEVPLKFELSGLSCPNGHNEDANGVYTYQGQTHDGRPFYKGPESDGPYFFYDRECDGEKGGADNWWGQFIIKWESDPPSQTTKWDLDGDSTCTRMASAYYGQNGKTKSSNGDKPWYHGKAGALPEDNVKWRVWCTGKVGVTAQRLRIKGSIAAVKKPLVAKGKWQFITVLPDGTTRTETYGVDRTQTSGGAWDLGSEISSTVGTSAKVGLSFLAEGEVDASLTATARGSMERSWSAATSAGHKVETTMTFPKGGAMWQWVFTVEQGEHRGVLPANQFALTKDGGTPPRCYPGQETDLLNYQECRPGGECDHCY
ncbi:unnamed protein product [Durusdinium trenchii]|uniref:Tocopherol cyclase n=1 Tax=Durusdinium trenchii TaxID=1381693 RepID=A0ABP0H7Y7_9DINO